MKNLSFVSGTANPLLAQAVADIIGIPLQPMDRLEQFADGEWYVRFGDSVRGKHVVIFQPTCPPVNDNIMQLFVMIDAAVRATAKSISVVTAYFGYARQDRKVRGREPISAAMVCNLLKIAGADRILALDLHAGQIQGFFKGPFDNLPLAGVLLSHFQEKVDWKDVILMSPDTTGTARCEEASNLLGCPIGFVRKRRAEANQSESLEVIGEVAGRTVIFIDDICDTGGTLTGGAKLVTSLGATHVHAVCTHALLSGKAVDLLENSPIETLVVSDTIPIPLAKMTPKIHVISAAQTLAEMIKNVHQEASVTSVGKHAFDWARNP